MIEAVNESIVMIEPKIVLAGEEIIVLPDGTNPDTLTTNGTYQIDYNIITVKVASDSTSGTIINQISTADDSTYTYRQSIDGGGTWTTPIQFVGYNELVLKADKANPTITGLATIQTAKIGNVIGGNYTEFEADGTMISRGDSTTYMDVIIPMFLRGVPAEPEAVAFPLNGIGLQPRFRVNDILTLQNAEAPHDWEEGSEIEIHMHYSNASEDSTDRYIKFTLEYAIANMVANGNTGTQFIRGTEDIEWFIPANTPAYTHLYKTLKVIDATAMANVKIGAGFVGSIKRITATGTAPSVNPYVLNLGIHYKANTLGSRTTTSK